MICRALLFCVTYLTIGMAAVPGSAAETFQDCPECPVMTVVPAGSFKMGSPQEVLNANEGPQHMVTFRKDFAVGIHHITFDQWGICVADGGCGSYVPPDQDWGRGNRPAIYISWQDAKAYVRWLNEKVAKAQSIPEVGATSANPSPNAAGPYRLLSEAEWEYAARAGTTTSYYWGDRRDKGKANCDGCGSEWDNKLTSPVGSFAPNQFGLYDMAGNVLQWVEDCYHKTYDLAPATGAAWTSGPCEARVMRGGSYFNSTYYIRSSQRFAVSAHIRANNSGFRVAKTLE